MLSGRVLDREKRRLGYRKRGWCGRNRGLAQRRESNALLVGELKAS